VKPTEAIPVPRTPRWMHSSKNEWEDTIAVSLGRTVTLSVGTFGVGPRGGREVRYPVRAGIDEQGIAMGGCNLYRDLEEATAGFLRACERAGARENIEWLRRVAYAADEVYGNECRRVYGRHACEKRYQQRHEDPAVQRAMERKLEADDAYHSALEGL